MKKRVTIIVVILTVFVSIGLVLASNKKEIDARNKVVDRSQIPVSVSITRASLQQVKGILQLPALLEPSKQADISAYAAGKITSLRIALGSRVSQGQSIGSIDTRQQQLGWQDANQALAKAQQDYQRNKELFEANAGTAQSVKDSKHALESADIRAQQASRQVGDGAIKAPISGIVTVKNSEPGEYVNSGTPIATIVDIYNLKAVVHVSEKDVYQLKQNQQATITTDVLPGKTFSGKVSFVSPVGDENHNYRVEIALDNKSGELKAGTYIKTEFDLGNDFMALQIPKVALVEGTKNPYVYVTNTDKAYTRKITIGRELGDNIEVLNGLKEGDEVVISGQINLVEGSRISKVDSK